MGGVDVEPGQISQNNDYKLNNQQSRIYLSLCHNSQTILWAHSASYPMNNGMLLLG
jgi:hypothetical protein